MTQSPNGPLRVGGPVGSGKTALLFVRSGNAGVSHNPPETVTAGDADLAARVLLDAIVNLD
jgi:Ni2+-binding GTPase involved in maturation of urease and hydrogenase